MKTLFDPTTYQEIIRRIDAVEPNSARQWGKMTPAQMFEHTARVIEMAAGKVPTRQMLLGKILGPFVRKSFLGPKPFAKNGPTGPDLVITTEPDFAPTKARLKALLADFHALGERGTDGNIHGFFGKLSGREWGETQYKHVDHHLTQFGC